MRDSGLVDANGARKVLLAHLLRFAKLGDSPVDWAFQSPTFARTLHAVKVDQRSTFVNTESTTVLLDSVKPLMFMGDERHKKSPPAVDPEPVTELFVKQVNAKLAANDAFNMERGLKKGDRDYRPCSHADLADATGADPNSIKNMLGGVRAGTKAKKIGRSKYVRAIREVLDIPQMVSMLVPADRLAILDRLSKIPMPLLKRLQEELRQLEDKLPKDPR